MYRPSTSSTTSCVRELVGPDNPFRAPAGEGYARRSPSISTRQKPCQDCVGDEERVLKVGEWSDWVPVEFALIPFQSLRGMCRFYLKQVVPPSSCTSARSISTRSTPAMPISTPESYAGELAQATGRFYTQGMAEDTKGLNEGVLYA